MPFEDLEYLNGRWRNRLTGTYPLLLHFNGGAKHRWKEIYTRGGVNGEASRLRDGTFDIGGDKRCTLDTLCPDWRGGFDGRGDL
jgi:hypothetical protein